MTTEANPAAGAVAPAAPSTPVLAPAPAPAAPAVAPPSADPEWLNGRIAQAKQSAQAELLKSLGVQNVDDVKAAIASANAKAEAEKTAETRAAELKSRLDAETARAGEQGKVIAEFAGRQMGVLTAEQKSAVMAIAGDDAGAQLRAIAALQPTWAAPTAVVTPPAVDTAPGHTAPSATNPGSPPNHRAAYEAAQKTNPFAAAEYGLRHQDEVYKPRP